MEIRYEPSDPWWVKPDVYVWLLPMVIVALFAWGLFGW